MIQGLSENIHTWDRPVIDELSKHFKTIIFDNRGVGRSDKLDGDLSVELMAADVLGLMNILNIKQAHILGHSLGGMIAQELALSNPERIKKLVLCSTSCGGSKAEPPSVETQSLLGRLAKKGHTKLLVKKAMPHTFSKKFIDENPRFIEKKINDFLIIPTEPTTFQAQMTAWMRYNSSRKLKNLEIPTLIMQGIQDMMVPPSNSELLAEKLPNAEVVYFDSAAHMIHLEEPDKFYDVLLKFLK